MGMGSRNSFAFSASRMKRRIGGAYLGKWMLTASISTAVANSVSYVSQESALKKEM